MATIQSFLKLNIEKGLLSSEMQKISKIFFGDFIDSFENWRFKFYFFQLFLENIFFAFCERLDGSAKDISSSEFGNCWEQPLSATDLLVGVLIHIFNSIVEICSSIVCGNLIMLL